MLLEFSVGNFMSFKDVSTLSMVASRKSELRDTNVFQVKKGINAIKSAVIYGANASGKSNFMSALLYMVEFIIKSAKDSQVGEKIDVSPFLMNTETQNKPSSFEMVFVISSTTYKYGFSTTKTEVLKEWLYKVVGTTETLVFERDKNKLNFAKSFETQAKKYPIELRENALYLSLSAMYGVALPKKIVKYVVDKFMFIDDSMFGISYRGSSKNTTGDKKLLLFLRTADININSFSDEESEIVLGGKKRKVSNPQLNYNVYNSSKEIVDEISMSLFEVESQGTRKLFIIARFIISALLEGKILVVDEFSNSLHPAITKFIVEAFNSIEINKSNAQFIADTHDTNLMNNKLLRRDQIWFTKKNRYGESELFSLEEYAEVRSDASYEKNYLQGRYGGIPYIDIDALADIWEEGETVGD